MSLQPIHISALWQRRGESASMVALRLRRYLALIRPALPEDLKWWAYKDSEGTLSIDIERDSLQLEALLEASCDREGDDDAPPYMGFSLTSFLAAEDPRTKPAVGAQVRLQAGATNFQNSFIFDSDVFFSDRSDQRLVTYATIRANMMAAVWAFEPEYCQAAPQILQNYLDGAVYNRPFISLAWMVWLQASLAAQVTPPADCWHVIKEAYSDGSLFLATGTEAFSCDDPRQLEKARAIHRQLDHLNFTVPFEGQCGRNPRVPPFPQL